MPLSGRIRFKPQHLIEDKIKERYFDYSKKLREAQDTAIEEQSLRIEAEEKAMRSIGHSGRLELQILISGTSSKLS